MQQTKVWVQVAQSLALGTLANQSLTFFQLVDTHQLELLER
jgi:hypothetical protein